MLNKLLNELLPFFPVVGALVPPPESGPGEIGSSDSLYKLLGKVIMIIALTGWMAVAILGKVVWDQHIQATDVQEKNQARIMEFQAQFAKQLGALCSEVTRIKTRQDVVIDDLKGLHQEQSDQWRAIREKGK